MILSVVVGMEHLGFLTARAFGRCEEGEDTGWGAVLCKHLLLLP